MKLRITTAAAAIASIFAISAGATGTAGGSSPQATGPGVIGTPTQTGATTSVYAVNETEFLRLDANSDNRLSKEELSSMSALQQEWHAIDRDHDGFLSRDELAQYHATRPRTDTLAAEGTGTAGGRDATMGLDGSASGGAVQALPDQSSASRVAGSGGSTDMTTGAEAAARSDTVQPLPEHAAPGGASPGSTDSTTGSDTRAEGTPVVIVIIDEPQFVRLDKDGDGRLSRDEVSAVGRMQHSWDAMDADRDGYVSRAELNEYQAKLGHAATPGVTSTPSDATTPGSAPGATGEGTRQ